MSWIEREFLQSCLLSGTPICQIPEALREDERHQIQPLKTFLQPEMKRADVTVVIPTHRQIPIGLQAWKMQTENILILQNGSFHQHVEGVTIRHVDWNGHGATRQAALSMVHTPYVLFTVDDAIPMSGAISALIQILSDESWDAVMARQIPFPTADRRTRDDLHRWTPHASGAYAVPQTDHVGTLYRTEDLRCNPIPDVPIAEDSHWSVGKQVACVPDAVLVHSHPRTIRGVASREFKIHRELDKLNMSTPLTFSEAVLGGVSTVRTYGFREACLSTVQNLARFAAQRVPKQPSPY